ncbi:Fibronectin type III [Candidatus Nanopelagicaceae bacterium]
MRFSSKSVNTLVSFVLSLFLLLGLLQVFYLLLPAPANAANGDPGSIAFTRTAGPNDQHLSTTVVAPGSDSLTYEWWFKYTNDTLGDMGMLVTRNGGSGCDGIDATIGNGKLRWGKCSWISDGDLALPKDQWNHIAFVRTGSTSWVVYLNGESKLTYSTTAALTPTTSTYLRIGRKFGDTETFSGNITNFRYVKGVPVYTGNFTVPTSQLTATQSSGVNISAITGTQTQLLLNMRQGNATTDDSSFSRTITTNGSPVSSSETPFLANQTIAFATLSNKTLGMSPFLVNASSTSALAVAFTSATSGICTVSGSTVTLVAAGLCTINADQAGNASYNAAQQVQQSFTVFLNQSPLAVNSASGTFGSTTTLGTSGGSGTGAVSYTVVSGNCSVSGDVLSNTSAGNCVITATKAGDGTYGSITSAQITVVIAKKSLVFPFSIASSTGAFTYGATYTITMTFPADAVAGIGTWKVFKASTAYGINGAGDEVCSGSTVTAAGNYTCSFNSASMYPTAQAIAISGLHVKFNGSTNYNSFDQTTNGTKITIDSDCGYVFCPNSGAVTVTATNKTINFGAASGQLNHSISNGANGATTAWGVGCTSTYTTGAAVGTYPITCTSTSRPTGGPTPITNEWVAQNTNYTQLYNANVDNDRYTLKNPVDAICGTAAQWWVKCSFFTSDTYSNLTFVEGVLTVQKLTLTTPSAPAISSITSSSINVSYVSSVQATSHTLKIYASNGTTLLQTVANYISGSSITGLSNVTSYKVSISAIGDGTSTENSAESSQSAFTTLGVQANDLTITSMSGTYGTDISLVSTGGSGTGALTYATSTAGCSLPTSTTLRATGALTCQISVTKAADATYASATSGLINIAFAAKTLTITGLSGVNRAFDGGVVGTVSGTATLSGIINSDVVTLLGTPTFAFANASVGDSKTVTASGYSLTGADASKYGLTQPTVTANITKKSATVTATSSTIAVGSSYTPAFSTSGLAGSDSITAVTYSFSSTGTGTPPTTVGSSTITPSAAIFGVLGAGDNYNLSYVTGTLDIVSSYLISFKSNFTSSDTSTVTVNFVPGDSPINQAAPTRSNFTFLGWFTSAIGGTKVNGGITPVADTTYWAHWIQNSLNGMGSATKIGSITTDIQYLDTFTRTGDYGTVTISIPAGALPHQTLVDIYQVTDPTRANSLLVGSNYVLSLVVAWLAPDATVPTTQTGKPVTMTISNGTIKKGAKVYAIVNDVVTLLGTATQDGSAEVRITDDPEVVIVLTKPDAPTGVSATSGGNATSTVSWTVPTSDGGSAITEYTATSSGGQSCVSTTTSCSVSGLTNGTAYTFTVTATNAIGISDSSTASSPITPSAPAPTPAPSGGGGGGGTVYVAPTPDPAIAIAEAAKAKAAAEKIAADAKAAADLKAAQDKAAAEAAQAAALKAAQELADAQAKADAELKAAQDKAQEDARIAEELRMAQEKAEADLRAAAEKKAAEDAAAAALLAARKIVPNVTLYSISTSLKLSTYDSSYLKKYVSKLKPTAKVTCVGYIYTKNTSYSKAKALASKQAKAVCALIKAQKKTIVTSTILYPSSKAPKAANGAKWVAVSYRVDGFKS